MRIYLVRHGQSMSNIDKAVHLTTADHAIPLSLQGHEDAKRAGKIIMRDLHRLDTENKKTSAQGGLLPNKMGPFGTLGRVRIWHSPYKRTVQTANEIEEELRGLPSLDRREHVLLCEQQFGLFDGIPDEELSIRYPDEAAHYDKCLQFEGKFWARMPLGESRFDVANRVHHAFGTFHRDEAKWGIDTLVVVCHGVTLRAFVMMWLHKSVQWFEEEPNPKNGAVRLIDDHEDYGYLE